MADFRALTSTECDALEQGLNLAAKIVGVQRPLTFTQVQCLYDSYLDEQIDEPDAIIALGLSFGQCLTNEDRFEWGRFVDESGEETCLAFSGVAIYVYPISMIRKRLARREKLSIEQLCRDTILQVEVMLKTGDYIPR